MKFLLAVMVYGRQKTREMDLVILMGSRSPVPLESGFLQVLDFYFSGWHFGINFFFPFTFTHLSPMDSSLKTQGKMVL